MTEGDDAAKLEEIHDMVTEALAPVFNRYKGRAPMVASAITAHLSYFISMTAKEPEQVLAHFAEIMRTCDWELARRMAGGFQPTVIEGGNGNG